jgi:hypothetical protein
MIEYLPLVLTGLGLAASIVYYAYVVRNAERARRRDIIFQRFQGYSVDYFRAYNNVALQNDWKTPEEYIVKYTRYGDPEAAANYQYILRVYTLAGVMYMEGIADLDLIFRLYPASSVIRTWEQFEPVRKYQVEVMNYPAENFEPFNILYKEAKKRTPVTRTRNDTLKLITELQEKT